MLLAMPDLVSNKRICRQIQGHLLGKSLFRKRDSRSPVYAAFVFLVDECPLECVRFGCSPQIVAARLESMIFVCFAWYRTASVKCRWPWRLPGEHEAVRRGVGGPVYLSIVRVGKWLYEPISVVLMFCNRVAKLDYHRFVDSFGLAASQRVIRRCCRLLDINKSAKRCEEFGHKLRVVVRKEDEWHAVWQDPDIEEDARNIYRYCSRQRNNPSNF